MTIFACSPPVCWGGFITPGNGTTVPANLPGIHWRPSREFSTPTNDPNLVTLATTADPSTPLPVTATMLASGDYVLVPDSPLVAGTSYVVSDGNPCGNGTGPTATFTAGATAPLPTQLGTLTIHTPTVGPLSVLTSSGSCSADVTAAQASLDLVLASDAAPWVHALLFETRVDGTLWSPQSSITTLNAPGMMVDKVFHTCETSDMAADQGLALGTHEVIVRASLPGSTSTLSTSAASVELYCDAMWPDDLDEPGPDGGCSVGSELGATWLVALAALLVLRRRR